MQAGKGEIEPMEVSERFQEIFLSLQKFLLKPRESFQEDYKKKSPEFSAFSVLNLLENQISNMLAELLNPDGFHAHGKIFLDLFIQHFVKDTADIGLPRKYEKATVTREFPKKEGRIDILVDFNNNAYGLAIENKLSANDQNTQCLRYAQVLNKQYGENKFILFYLNKFGTPPSKDSLPEDKRRELGPKFRVIKYKEISEWLDRCAEAAEKNQAKRLAEAIKEFSFFIKKDFYKENIMINELIGKEIEEHILEAHEIYLLWKSKTRQEKKLSKDERKKHKKLEEKNYFWQIWRKKVNLLFNETLPELIFKKLKEDNVIGDDWEYVKGDFDIEKEHLRGFKLKKKNWKHFAIGVFSDAIERGEGKRSFFPVILSKKNIHRENYADIYKSATGCVKSFSLKNPPSPWWVDFPDPKYQIWGYEQWAGIKEGGDTVNYIADFLAKLIKACEKDIDEEEKRLQG